MGEVVSHWTKKRVCPICKKEFFPAPYHVYKDARTHHGALVCSYSCMTESERIRDGKRKPRKRDPETYHDCRGHRLYTAEEEARIFELLGQGVSYREIARILGRSLNSVRNHLDYIKGKVR